MTTFRWVLRDVEGAELRASDDFSSKEDAEDWMGAEWSKLLEEGAETVSLMQGSEQLYRMSLREA